MGAAMGLRSRSSNHLTVQHLKLLAIVGIFCSTLGCGGKQTTGQSKLGFAAYVVRVNASATPAQIATLSSFGLLSDRQNSFGGGGLLFRMTEVQLQQVQQLSFVATVEPLQASDKFDAAAIEAAPDPVSLTIDTFDHLGDSHREEVAKFIGAKGAVIRWVSRSTLRVEVAKSLITPIALLDAVLWIEPATTDNGPKQ